MKLRDVNGKLFKIQFQKVLNKKSGETELHMVIGVNGQLITNIGTVWLNDLIGVAIEARMILEAHAEQPNSQVNWITRSTGA